MNRCDRRRIKPASGGGVRARDHPSLGQRYHVMKVRLVSVNRLTVEKRAKLVPASRKVRPPADQRMEFAKLRRAWTALKRRKKSPCRKFQPVSSSA
jgi:hypothetical protein